MLWELVIGSVYMQIVRIIGGYWICYQKHESVPSHNVTYCAYLPDVHLYQLVEKAGLEQTFNDPICNLFEIDVFTVMYFH